MCPATKSNTILNEQLVKKLEKPINRKFRKRKIYSYCKDNIQGADVADIQLISKYKKKLDFFMCY